MIESHLTYIINQNIAQNNYSENTKSANVRPISKKEERTKHKNIDLIVFQINFLKFERFMHKKLASYVICFSFRIYFNLPKIL